jgi:hypothetical protein
VVEVGRVTDLAVLEEVRSVELLLATLEALEVHK